MQLLDFGKRFEIAGEEINGNDTASLLSKVANKNIRYEGFPVEQLMSENEDFGLMFQWFDRVGYSCDIAALKAKFDEVDWLDFEKWAKARDWGFLGSNSS